MTTAPLPAARDFAARRRAPSKAAFSSKALPPARKGFARSHETVKLEYNSAVPERGDPAPTFAASEGRNVIKSL